MALGHAGIAFGHPLLAQQFPAKESVENIRLRATAFNAGSVGQEDSDVVEHRRLLDFGRVERQTATRGDFKREVGHRTAVAHINIPQG